MSNSLQKQSLNLYDNVFNPTEVRSEVKSDKYKALLSKKSRTTRKFFLNDHPDILVEVLKRLDGRSLGVAACVCRLWCSITTTDDTLWEYVCFRHVSPGPSVRPLVLALGGYKRLYMVCVRPVLRRLKRSSSLKRTGRCGGELSRRVWTRQGAQLLLSLFCVDYYEKLGSGGTRLGSDANANANANGNANGVPSSLMFLCKPVNV